MRGNDPVDVAELGLLVLLWVVQPLRRPAAIDSSVPCFEVANGSFGAFWLAEPGFG